jgi:hypothetical protein
MSDREIPQSEWEWQGPSDATSERAVELGIIKESEAMDATGSMTAEGAMAAHMDTCKRWSAFERQAASTAFTPANE